MRFGWDGHADEGTQQHRQHQHQHHSCMTHLDAVDVPLVVALAEQLASLAHTPPVPTTMEPRH